MKRRKRAKEPKQGLVQVAQVLEGALRTLGVRSEWDRYRLEGKCRELLGPEVSRVLTEVSEKQGVVTLSFGHGAFLQEMGFRKEELLKDLKAEFPKLGLKEIRAALSRSRAGRPPRE